MPFHISNSKKNFGTMGHSMLMTDYGLHVLKGSVESKWDTLSSKDQAKWTAAFAALQACKETTVWMMWNKDDQPNLTDQPHHPGYYGSGAKPGRGLINISGFASKSPDNAAFPEDLNKWGWGEMEAVGSYVNMISRWIAENDLKITFNGTLCKRAKILREKFESGEYEQVMYDATESLAEVNACVVFVGNGKGYLDGRGGTSPLAGARLFESSGAAYTTIRSRRLRNAVVVHVKTSLLHLDPESTPEAGSFEKLGAAIAMQEKKHLEAALEAASRDQLIARLQAFDTSGEVEDEPERKRRM